MPVYMGLDLGGTANARIVNDPEATPAPPMPAMARPMINVVLFLATAQIKLPISKTKIDIKNVDLSGKYL